MRTIRPVQYFSTEYLERCRSLKPIEILQFLESFRLLHGRGSARSRLISLKVPEDLLAHFRRRCALEGVPYQTRIKQLMQEWLQGVSAADAPRPAARRGTGGPRRPGR